MTAARGRGLEVLDAALGGPLSREAGEGTGGGLLSPLTPMPLQHLTHPRHQLGLRRRLLRALAQFEIIRAVLRRLGELRAEDEIADHDLPPSRRVALVRALDHRAKAAAPVGVFELRVHAALAEIEFGGDAGAAKLCDEALIIGHLIAVERDNDDW